MRKVLAFAVLVTSLAVAFFKAGRATLNERCSELEAGGWASVRPGKHLVFVEPDDRQGLAPSDLVPAAPTTVVLVRNAEREK